MNKIAAISMVKNEADIIEGFVRHTLEFADLMIVADHQSTDATGEILKALQAEGLPLVVKKYAGAGQDQAEVLTVLLKQSISKYMADIIVPLDADEFLLVTEKGSGVRDILQQARTDAAYEIDSVTYRPAGPVTAGEYLLSRPCLRQKVSDGLKKTIFGAKAVLKYQLTVAQGNHHPLTEAGTDFEQIGNLPLYLAHFHWRSDEQVLSKALCGWLGNVAKYSYWTDIALHWRARFLQLVRGKETSDIFNAADYELVNPLAPPMLIRYSAQAQCALLRNVLLVAENIANSYAVKEVIRRSGLVSVCLFLDGSYEALAASVESILAQTYPHERLEIFLLDLSGNKREICDRLLEKYGNELSINVLSVTDYGDELMTALKEQSKGEYIQWLEAGDELLPEKITVMVTALAGMHYRECVYSDSMTVMPEELQQLSVPRPSYQHSTDWSGEKFRSGLMAMKLPLSGRIAGFLFLRCSMDEDADWFRQAVYDGKFHLFAAYRAVFSGCHVCGIIFEDVVRCSAEYAGERWQRYIKEIAEAE